MSNSEEKKIFTGINNIQLPSFNFNMPSFNFSNRNSIKAEELFEVKQIENMRELFKGAYEKYKGTTPFILKNKRRNISISKEIDKSLEYEEYTNISMEEYYNTFNYFGEKLYNLGLKGKRIGIISENRYEWTVAYATVVSGLGFAVPLDKNLPKDELKNIILRDNLGAIIVSYKIYPMLVEILTELAKDDKKYKDITIILMDIYVTKKESDNIEETILNSKDNDFAVYSQSELIAGGKELQDNGVLEYSKVEINRDDVVQILYTSATTSNSKAVRLTHKNICSNVRDIASMFDVQVGDRFLSFLPIHHAFECTVGFIYPIFAGATICYADSLRKIADNLKEYEITAIISVPLLLESIYNRIIQNVKKSGKEKQFAIGINVSNSLRKLGIDKRKEIFKDIHERVGGKLRLVVVGAAALTEDAHKKLNEIGINVYQGYGLTETSPVLAAGHGKVNVPGSVGRALPSVDIMIDKRPDEQMGEILAKGPNIMVGYENDEENNKAVFTDNGWFKTGDLGYFDKEGNLFITGRAKNVIVLKNGKNIFPDESEILLNGIEGVVETMVFGYAKDEDKTDISLYAKIVIDRDKFKDKDDNEIHEFIWEHVKEINRIQPTYKFIKKILITDEPLIKTTTLKVKRHEEMKKIEEELKKEN